MDHAEVIIRRYVRSIWANYIGVTTDATDANVSNFARKYNYSTLRQSNVCTYSRSDKYMLDNDQNCLLQVMQLMQLMQKQESNITSTKLAQLLDDSW